VLLQKDEAVEEYDHLRLTLETVCQVLQYSETSLITLQAAIVSAGSLRRSGPPSEQVGPQHA